MAAEYAIRGMNGSHFVVITRDASADVWLDLATCQRFADANRIVLGMTEAEEAWTNAKRECAAEEAALPEDMEAEFVDKTAHIRDWVDGRVVPRNALKSELTYWTRTV